MLAKRIIPCLDVTDGRVVKGTNFINLKDAGDPVELAKLYNDQGADELVFLDITASSDKRYILRELVEKTAAEVFIPFTVGGGISDIDTIRDLLNAGADKVSINTAAILNENLISQVAKKFGSQCIVGAVDVKRSKNDWEVFSHGGSINTGKRAINWMKHLEKLGVGEILLTSMNKDGTREGFDVELLNKASNELSIPIIASGGVGKLSHFKDGIILGKASALLAASVFHFGELSILKVKQYLNDEGLNVRID